MSAKDAEIGVRSIGGGGWEVAARQRPLPGCRCRRAAGDPEVLRVGRPSVIRFGWGLKSPYRVSGAPQQRHRTRRAAAAVHGVPPSVAAESTAEYTAFGQLGAVYKCRKDSCSCRRIGETAARCSRACVGSGVLRS